MTESSDCFIVVALVRSLSVFARTIRYVAHSQYIYNEENRPSAFCASPRRIELIQDYVDSDYLKTIRQGSEGFLDLFSRLGLPKSGYDFSGFSSGVKPISLSDLSRSIANVPPGRASA